MPDAWQSAVFFFGGSETVGTPTPNPLARCWSVGSNKRALAFSCHLSLARAGNDEPLDEPRGGRGGGAPGRGNGGPPDGGGDTRARGARHAVNRNLQTPKLYKI